jgi:DNA repair exonuclease SbcCD ATPase subunit
LEKKIGRLGNLKERYERTSQEVIEDISIPSEFENHRAQVQTRIDALNQEIPSLTRQLNKRQVIEQELAELSRQVQILPSLCDDIGQMQRELEALEAASKQGTLYNQILTTGQEYLEQAQPEHCPLCKQKVLDLQALLGRLRQETPEDVERMRREYKTLRETFEQKRDQAAQLEQKQRQIQELEMTLTEFPEDLESQIKGKQKESESLTNELATVQAEIIRIKGRIKLAAEYRRRLNVVLKEVEEALGQPPDADMASTLDQAIRATRERATEIQALDFQPIVANLDQAKQLGQIEKDEAQLRQRLETVLEEVKEALGQPPGEDVAGALDRAIRATRERAAEIQALDFQPIVAKLDQAKQLGQIKKDEAQLRQRLDAVLEEVGETLGQPLGEDVASALDQAIQATRERAAEIQAFDFQPIARELDRTKQLDEIRKDEIRLREFESSYQTASREKARLNYQIQRLTDLRNALQDIAETTKRHQQTIVTGVLNALDIHSYYQQLDPHPVYRQLQIEPELTGKGTYNYWIKALTDDRSYGTYVQTRFSTAQANCAAIAIFLAVNHQLSKKLETIILDDPSQSMDPEHKMRLAQTLATIPHQVIVATEDAQTFEFLVDAFDTPTIHRLGSWTVDGASLVG